MRSGLFVGMTSFACLVFPSRSATADDSLGRKSQERSQTFVRKSRSDGRYWLSAWSSVVALRLRKHAPNESWDLRPRLPHITALQFIIGIFALLVFGQTSFANNDARFIAGLRERRLFDLAETYCNERLSEQELSAKDRVEVSVELIRVHTEHALNSRGETRDKFWASAKEVTNRFDDQSAPRVVLVRVQAALADLARGELERLEAEVSAQTNEALVSARTTLRSSAAELTAIDRELTDAIPIRRRNPLRPNELSAGELTSLQNHVRYQLARCYKNQALCYEADSSDRIASLTAATDQLTQSLTQVAPGQDLYFELRLEQLTCYRLLNDGDKVASLLKSLVDSELSPNERLAVRAEQLRWEVKRSNRSEALKLVGAGRTIGSIVSSDLDFAWLEAYVSFWKAAADTNDAQQTKDWRDKSVAMAKFIEQEHGAYWGRRAEVLLVHVGARSGDGSVEILQRTADDLYRKAKFDDAVTAYDKASEAALKADAVDQAFALAYKAALVVQQQANHETASTRFRKLALKLKGYEHAANAHRLAIDNTRKASSAAGKWIDGYPDLLREHLQNWPSSASADVAAYWLGEFESGRRDWRKAVEAFSQVKPDAPHFAQAVELLGQCWISLLDQHSADETAVTGELQRARETLDRTIRPDGKTPASWSPAQLAALKALASIELNFGDDHFNDVEALLKSSLDGTPPASDRWRAEATSLLVAAIARQPGRQADALAMLGHVGAASTSQLFDLFRQISSLMETTSGSAHRDLAKLTIDVADRLTSKRSELDASQLLTIDRSRAHALAATGDFESADALFAQLATKHPSNGSLQRDYAEFLLHSDQESYIKKSLDKWRGIAARTRPRTESWFRAKYSVALAQYKLNDKAGAAKLIRYLQATEDLTKSGLEADFRELLDRCNE